MKTVTYSKNKPLLVPKHEAVATVELHGTKAKVCFADVLVDTGADYVQLPLQTITVAGMQLGLNGIVVRGVGGITKMLLAQNVPLIIEGISAHADVLFDPSPQSRPLLGRSGLKALNEFGFDVADWYWI